MLVISRKTGETVYIGPDIEVQILEVMGSKVRIGITAPEQLLIRREPPAVEPAPAEVKQ